MHPFSKHWRRTLEEERWREKAQPFIAEGWAHSSRQSVRLRSGENTKSSETSYRLPISCQPAAHRSHGHRQILTGSVADNPKAPTVC